MADGSSCLCLCLSHAGSHLWNKHKREISTSTSTSTKNGKVSFSCAYAYAYLAPVPTRLFLCLCLCLCLSHKWEPGLTVGSRELVTFQFFVNELRRLRTIKWVKHENAHEICLPRALACFSRFTVLILGLLSVYNYLQIVSTQQAKTQPKKPSLRSNKHMKTKQVFWKHAGRQPIIWVLCSKHRSQIWNGPLLSFWLILNIFSAISNCRLRLVPLFL